MKPVQQVFALVLEQIPGFDSISTKFYEELEKFRAKLPIEKFLKKEQDIRNKQIKHIIFEEYLSICENMKRRQMSLESMKFSILGNDIASVFKSSKPKKKFDPSTLF